MAYCMINGEMLDTKSAGIGITDLGLQRGYGIFDYFKTLGGKPIFLDEHLDRFYHSAAHMRLQVVYSREELKKMIYALLEKNASPDSGIKLLLTGGYSTDGFNIGAPNLVITQGPLPAYGDSQGKGIRIVTYQHRRQMPEVKTIDYLMAVWLQPIIAEKNARDVLYHDGNIITECPRSNIFIVTRQGKILTPAKNVLKGIIRSQLIKLANIYPVAEADISLEDLYDANEVFVTSTTKNILPVYQVDDQLINAGEPGKITIELSTALDSLIEEHRNYNQFSGTGNVVTQ